MKKYKNIIFDIGNILISYRWLDMIMELGVSLEEAKQIGGEIFNTPEWADKFDRGLVDADGICEILGEKYPNHREAFDWVVHHPEKMPIDRPEVWKLIDELKKSGYKLFYLSNYSHYLLDTHTENMPWPALMDGGILSCDVHLIKPEPEIYQCLLETYELKAEECFFLDDRPENVEAAIREGIDGFVADTEAKLIAKLLEFLEL